MKNKTIVIGGSVYEEVKIELEDSQVWLWQDEELLGMDIIQAEAVANVILKHVAAIRAAGAKEQKREEK